MSVSENNQTDSEFKKTDLKTPERKLNLKSKLTGPIANMSELRKSLLFAELAMIAYNDDAEVREAVSVIGFDQVVFFDRDGSQAYKIANQNEVVITCRGTEPNEWNDIQADANAIAALAETAGKVHSGFKQEVDDLWPMIEKELKGCDQPIYFTGHSLGAAMATICAQRCFLSHMDAMPKELYTYGSPRVGCKKYINYCELDYKRWVNNNDIVTRVPPPWMGYRHTGTEFYINSKGVVGSVRGWRRVRDRLRGLFSGLLRFKIDYLSDHSVRDYIQHIVNAVCKEEGITPEELYSQGPRSDL